MNNFPTIIQPDAMDCGTACLKMIASHYGKHYGMDTLRAAFHITHEGVLLLGLSEAAEQIGFKTLGGRFTIKQLVEAVPLPCIVH